MLKLLKKQQGLPFLLALGVLFILSSSFLAVQLWTDHENFRGAAAALEAPMLPPSLNSPSVVAPPPEKKTEPEAKPVKKEAPSVAKVDLSEVNQEKGSEVEEAEPAKTLPVTEVPKKSLKIQAVQLEKPAVQINMDSEKKTAVQARPKAAKKVEQKPVEKPEVEAPREKVEEPKALKPVEKPVVVKVVEIAPMTAPVEEVAVKKAVKRVRKETVPTEVPPEWNWFSKPLKIEMAAGKLEIKADSATEKVVRLVSSPRIVEKTVKLATVEVSAINSKAVPMVEQPFSRALAKMAKLREKRAASPVKAEKKPAKVVEDATAALNRLQDMLKLIKSTSRSLEVCEETIALDEKETGVELESKEVVVAADKVEAGSIVVAPYQNKVNEKREYVGSDSSFSKKVNELIRSGAWLRD